MFRDSSVIIMKEVQDHSKELKKIGRRIRNVRMDRGLSQSELARYAGLSEQCISYIERGAREPQVLNLLRIAQVLSCSTDYLLRGKIHVSDIPVFLCGLGKIDPNRINDFFSVIERFAK